MMFKVFIQFNTFISICHVILCYERESTMKTKLLNEKCVTSDECDDRNAYCDLTKRVCVCSVEYYAQISAQKCVMKRPKYTHHYKKFGERCEFYDCDPKSALVCGYRKTCVCTPNNVHHNGVCASSSDTPSGDYNSTYHMLYMIFLIVLAAIGVCLCWAFCVKFCVKMRICHYREPPPTNQTDSALDSNPDFNNMSVSAQPITGQRNNVIINNNSYPVPYNSNTMLGNNNNNTQSTAHTIIIPSAPLVNYSQQLHQQNQFAYEDKPPSYYEATNYRR